MSRDRVARAEQALTDLLLPYRHFQDLYDFLRLCARQDRASTPVLHWLVREAREVKDFARPAMAREINQRVLTRVRQLLVDDAIALVDLRALANLAAQDAGRLKAELELYAGHLRLDGGCVDRVFLLVSTLALVDKVEALQVGDQPLSSAPLTLAHWALGPPPHSQSIAAPCYSTAI